MKRRRWPHPGWLALSILAMLALIVPVAYVATPFVQQWRTVRQLTSETPAARERALNFVIRHANDRPRVLRGAFAQAAVADDENFIQITNALDAAGTWRRDRVPRDLWLRWLGVLAEDAGVGSRVLAAQRLADLHEVVDDRRVHAMLEALLNDEDATVRYNALVAAAELSGHAKDRETYDALIALRSQDDEPTVARHALLMLGLLRTRVDDAALERANDSASHALVNEAALWAKLAAAPHEPGPALRVLNDADAPLRSRAMAAYALHHSDVPAAHDALLAWLERDAAAMSRAERTILWRVVLALPEGERAAAALHDWLARHNTAEAMADEALRPVVLAATHRFAQVGGDMDRVAVHDSLQHLALLEGAGDRALASVAITPNMPPDIPPDIPADMPPMARLAALAAMDQPDAEAFWPLLTHEESSLRDLACVVAVDRLNDDARQALIGELLISLNRQANQSGAMMAGLTGEQTELLRKAIAAKTDWAVQTVMRLGLWMQGELPEMDRQAPAYLARQDLPRSTVLLALLAHRPAIALDQLLVPRGEPGPELLTLLDHYRWWRVLERALPEDAPRLWLWADEELKQFQLELLREWYLLHRESVRNGGSAGESALPG